MSSKVALISDVHGNIEALDACLADLATYRVDAVFNLGDVFGYGPEPDRCLERLLDICKGSVRGNHDDYIANSTDCPRSSSANIALDIQRSRISSTSILELRALPLTLDLDSPTISLRHGGWTDPLDEYLEPSPEYFASMSLGFYFSGHTHIPRQWRDERILYCNPGSVGQPRDGDWRASYALVDLASRKVLFRRIPYDVDRVAAAMRRQGFPRHNFRNLVVGLRV